MATRKELLASLSTLGGGLSEMQDRIMKAKSFEQDQQEKKDQADYLAKFRPLSLQSEQQNIDIKGQQFKEGQSKAEASQKLVAAREALDSQISGEWGFIDPADAPNLPQWRAKLAVLNRSGDTPITPQEFYQAQKESKAKETRSSEAHKSQLATDEANRQKGSFTPYQLSDGRLGAFNTRTGKVAETGEQFNPNTGRRGIDGLNEQERRDRQVFAAKDKLRDTYEKTGTANAIVMLNDIASKIGGVDGQGNIAGIGTQNLTPQFLLTQEGKDVRTSLAGLRNIVLKDRSGAAVTNQEFERLKEEIGGGIFTTDADLRSKLKRMGEIVAQHAQSIDATFQGDPEIPRQAFEEYKASGGVLGSSLNLSGKKTPQDRNGASGSWGGNDNDALDAVYGSPGSSGGFDFSRFKRGGN